MPLTAVVDRLQPGEPLPFDLFDDERRLLLARGQRVDPERTAALIARGAFAELDPVPVPRAALPTLWRDGLSRVDAALRDAAAPRFATALDEAARPLLALVERDPDLALFQALRHQGGPRVQYGVRRATTTAVTAALAARRLGWCGDEVERAFKVALTMNVSMFGLQADLAAQRAPLTPLQQRLLRTHPLRSRALLERGGVRDGDWLLAVERHHEAEDGGGYPRGTRDVGELAGLVRRVDVYTAKLAAREHRAALAADVAGRQMFMSEPGHPMVAALVKELGIHPPGNFVRLASGAVGVVVARGATVATPVVACLSGPGGRPLARPLRVDTAERAHTITGIAGAGAFGRRLDDDELARLIVEA